MPDYEIIKRKPSADELIYLRKSIGWGIPDKKFLQIGLNNSLYAVCAACDKKVIGTARVVGDGTTVFYIQDVIVTPEFQRKGIGISMMKEIMGYIGRNACQGAVVGLMSAKGKEEFYERFGFRKRPDKNFGAGMMQLWENKN
jgi:predicted N-acetyltransferase YhbS